MRNLILLSTILFFAVSCDDKVYHWQIEKSIDDIDKIEIIDVVYAGTEKTIKTLSTIEQDDWEEIIKDISSINMFRYGTNLAEGSGKAIRIVFINGDYDLITSREPKHYKISESGKVEGYNSWLRFDNEQFFQMIEKWENK